VKNWVWIIFSIILISSCLDDGDCLRSGDPALVISFKNLSTGSADSLVFYNIAAEGADSVFYQDDPDVRDTLGTVTIAVNPFENETLFTFFLEAEQKTLRVGYKNEIRFISEECGSERVQYDLKVLETGFDSVRVVNPVLTKKRSTNIEIYN
jgi:hypothetical protein